MAKEMNKGMRAFGDKVDAISQKRPTEMTFGERLVYIRSKRGYSQQALADMAHVGKSTLNKYEQGALPTYDIIKKLSEALGVSYDFLFGESDSETRIVHDVTIATGLSDKAIKALRKMWLHNGLRSTGKMLDKGLSIEEVAEKRLSHNDNRTVKIVNFLLENYIDTSDLFGIRRNGVIATLENYFYFQPPEDKKVTLSDGDVTAYGRGKVVVGGVTFSAETLANVFLLELEMQLQDCREEFIARKEGEATNANQEK